MFADRSAGQLLRGRGGVTVGWVPSSGTPSRSPPPVARHAHHPRAAPRWLAATANRAGVRAPARHPHAPRRAASQIRAHLRGQTRKLQVADDPQHARALAGMRHHLERLGEVTRLRGSIVQHANLEQTAVQRNACVDFPALAGSTQQCAAAVDPRAARAERLFSGKWPLSQP